MAEQFSDTLPGSAAAIQSANILIVCRALACRLAAAAVEALADEDSGKLVGLCGDEICRVPLDNIVGEQRPLDPDLYNVSIPLGSRYRIRGVTVSVILLRKDDTRRIELASA